MSEEHEMTEGPSQQLHRQAKAGIEAGIKDGMTTQDAVEGSLARSPFTKALRQATEVIRQGVERGMVEAEARRARRAKLEEATKEQVILTQERTIVELLGEWATDREKVAEAMELWMELWQERQERQRKQDAVSGER